MRPVRPVTGPISIGPMQPGPPITATISIGDGESGEFYLRYFRPSSGRLVWVQIPVLLVFLWLVIWAIKSRQPFRVLVRQVGKWIWSRAYLLLTILTAAYFLLAMIVWLQAVNSNTPPQTVRHGPAPSALSPSDYTVLAEMTGPNQLRFGASDEIVLKLGITQGVVQSSCASLSPTQIYSATAYIQ